MTALSHYSPRAATAHPAPLFLEERSIVAGSELAWTTKRRRMPKTGRLAAYHIAEITWEERHV